MSAATQKEVKLIAIYGRTSTSNQENEGTIETQLSAVREFAKKHNYTIVKEYIDEGWSGDSIVRPNLDQLRVDAKSKIWDAVLMYDPDRLARRYSYQELVTDELREAGTEVMFVTVSAPKNSEDKILYGVRGLFAEYERAKISERFRLGKLRKVKGGYILVSEALYGYNYIPKQDAEHGYYKINADEAEVVKKIFSWIGYEGLTMRKVVRRLQEQGIKPRKSKRGVWSTSTLSTMLRHKGYIGETHWGSTYAVVPENPTNKEKYRKMKKTSRRIKPESEWITIPIPEIIDKQLFEKARVQLDKNFALCQRNRKNEYLLAGKIQCSCGRKRTGEGPQHGRYLYYRCSDRVLSFPLPPECSERGVNARIADSLVWRKIAGLMSSPELLSKQAKRHLTARKIKDRAAVPDASVVQKEIERLEAQERRYDKAYGAGLFTIEKLKEYTVPIREKLTTLNSQLRTADQLEREGAMDTMPSEKEIQRFTEAAQKVINSLNFSAKRAIVVDTVDSVIATQQNLHICGHIPITNHVEYKPNHRHSRSAKRREIHAF